MTKTYVAWGVVVLGIIGGLVWYFGNTSEHVNAPTQTPTANTPTDAKVITLTKDGFVPSTVTLHVGDTITFNTTTGTMFWPASNLHPSHLVYPEFDPKGPVQPDSSWSFTFTKPGEWKFHDHLAPYYTGVITVTE